MLCISPTRQSLAAGEGCRSKCFFSLFAWVVLVRLSAWWVEIVVCFDHSGSFQSFSQDIFCCYHEEVGIPPVYRRPVSASTGARGRGVI